MQLEPADLGVDELVLEAPPHAEFIGMARLFAGAVARHHKCDEDVVDDIKIAISEAVTNAIKAHQTTDNDSPIRVTARAADGRLTFEVLDEGGGFDESALTAESLTPPAGLYEGSLGLTVIRTLFEDCKIDSSPRGTSVRFSAKID